MTRIASNPELQRQNEDAKARKARINRAGPPACRAVTAPVVRAPIVRPDAGRRGPKKAPPLIEAIEAEHIVRCRCVNEAYEAERTRHRAAFTHVMEDCRRRELEDIEELRRYRVSLLKEVP